MKKVMTKVQIPAPKQEPYRLWDRAMVEHVNVTKEQGWALVDFYHDVAADLKNQIDAIDKERQ